MTNYYLAATYLSCGTSCLTGGKLMINIFIMYKIIIIEYKDSATSSNF